MGSVTMRGPVADGLFLPLIEERWDDLATEQCYWGAAGTAKSFQVMMALVIFLRRKTVGGVRVLWCRKTRKAITQSSLVTYRKVCKELGIPWSPKPHPSARQSEVFHTPAGMNELVWCGMNDPANLFSAEYDIVVTEEAIQVSLSTYENSVLRTLRNFALPVQLSICLTNPGPKASWLWQRMNRARPGAVAPQMVSHATTRYHNPAYYTSDGQITRKGRAYEKTLDGYTGTRRAILKDGEWVSEEGAVLDNWADSLHLFSGEYVKTPYRAPEIHIREAHDCLPDKVPLEWTFASADLGYVNAGVLLVWGVDKDGRLYLLDEVYHTRRDRDWWCERIIEMATYYDLDSVVCDWDKELHMYWNQTIGERLPQHHRDEYDPDRLAPGAPEPFVRRCRKSSGNKDALKVDVVRSLLNDGPDRIPRCFLMRDARRHKPDSDLVQAAKPTCLQEEIPQLVWKPLEAEVADDKLPEEKLKDGRANHGFDAWVYAGRYLADADESHAWDEMEPPTVPGTWEHHKRHMRERFQAEGLSS